MVLLYNSQRIFVVSNRTVRDVPSVGEVTRLQAGPLRTRIPAEATESCLLQNIQYSSGAHASLLINGHGIFVPALKRPNTEADPSPKPRAEVMNEWRHTSSPSIRFHGVDGVNFTLYDDVNMPSDQDSMELN